MTDCEIRALHDATTLTVYQAYRPEIAVPAARDGRFPAAFSRTRMTWIKPSFCWMMYRCGWATKPGQEHVLAIRMSRDGFAWALAHSALSSFDRDVHASAGEWRASVRGTPVRVQWDPERDIRLRPLARRTIQVGLSGEAARCYADEWIVGIEDVTARCRAIRERLTSGDVAGATAMLPVETPLGHPLATRILG